MVEDLSTKYIVIVGSEAKHWKPKGRVRAIFQIIDIIEYWADKGEIMIVTGGCPKGGIDLWVECICYAYGIPITIFDPDVHKWNDEKVGVVEGEEYKRRGYKSRNIQIADRGDILYLIDPAERDWSGGRWTYNYAKKLGKEVKEVMVEND